MNILPAQLSAIKRDWARLRSQINLLNLNLQTGRQIRSLLNQLTSFQTRLLRCRHVATRSSSRTRAQLLRSTLAQWRALIKRCLQIPALSRDTISYLRNSFQNIDPLNPNQWVIRFILLDAVFLRPYLPEIDLHAPISAQHNSSDPYWRVIKCNPSATRL